MKVPAKKVRTFDLSGNQNGYLTELGKDGEKTTSYLTVAFPGCFKGYHAHKVRTSNYVCIRGQVLVTLVGKDGIIAHHLSENNPERLHIPIMIPTGIHNISDEEAWLINVPEPAYDPALKDEQLDFTLEQALLWAKAEGEIDEVKRFTIKSELQNIYDDQKYRKIAQELRQGHENTKSCICLRCTAANELEKLSQMIYGPKGMVPDYKNVQDKIIDLELKLDYYELRDAQIPQPTAEIIKQLEKQAIEIALKGGANSIANTSETAARELRRLSNLLNAPKEKESG